MELGIYSFGDHSADANPGDIRKRIHAVVEHAILADDAGLDVIALGEHHQREFALSAPELLLAAVSTRTERIRLSTAVTVLPTQDPVRVFEQFATLDHLSGGRAEIVAGRGTFPQAFRLFGQDMADSDRLFDGKIRELLALAAAERPTRNGEAVVPPVVRRPLPVWIGVGGTQASAVRAGSLGAPMFMAVFTDAEPGRRLAEVYREAAAAAGHDPASLGVASGGHMFVGRTSQGARDTYFPYYSRYVRLAPQFAHGMPRPAYEEMVRGGLVVGSPQEVIDKIMHQRERIGITRYVGQFDVGGMPSAIVSKGLELFATEVAPVLRRETPRE